MSTPFLLLIAVLAYVTYNICLKKASTLIDSNWVAAISQGLSALAPLGLLLIAYIKYSGSEERNPVLWNTSGIILSLVAALLIGIFMITLCKIFEEGGNLSYVIPMIYGGVVALSSLCGWIIFKERIPLSQIIGLTLVLIGLGCIIWSKWSASA